MPFDNDPVACKQAATPDTSQVGRIDHGEGMVGGECIFIPSKQASNDSGGGGGSGGASSGPASGTAGPGAAVQREDEEDDGYLVTFVGRTDGTGKSGALRTFCFITQM